MTLPAHHELFPDLLVPCECCHAAEAVTAMVECLPCAVTRAEDAYDRALVEHARRGGSYDTRPVFIHPARQLSGAELEDAVQRHQAWHTWLATHPEARTLTGEAPHDVRGTETPRGTVGGRTDYVCKTRDAETSSDSPVLATPEVAR